MTQKTMDFPKRKGNEISIVIYVPSTKNESEKITSLEMKRRVDGTKKFLNKMFHGSTTIKGLGSFTFKGKLIEEEVKLVGTFTTKELYNANDLKIKKYLNNKRKQWGQVSMAFEYEEELFFI